MDRITPQILENKIHPRLRLNGICPYFTMFPLTFPYHILSRAKKNDLVYDPFCGRGTTNYAARLRGLRSFGVDSNPVAHAIAQSKLVNVRPKEVASLCLDIIMKSRLNQIPQGEFWEWSYHTLTLIDICKLRHYFKKKQKLTQVEVALRAIVLGILHGPIMLTQASYLSNQMPRTFATKPDYSVKYWRKRRMKPQYVDILHLVERKAEYIFNRSLPVKTGGKIIFGDSRELAKICDEKFDWIITSPPYFGMSTYEQDQWLRNWFLNGPEEVDYSNNSQVKHGSENTFTDDLAKVWINAARKSNPNAKLVIRFGALPSKSERTPAELIKESLKRADCGWKIKTIRPAGKPLESNRQANQFNNKTGKYIEEIDVFATLNS